MPDTKSQINALKHFGIFIDQLENYHLLSLDRQKKYEADYQGDIGAKWPDEFEWISLIRRLRKELIESGFQVPKHWLTAKTQPPFSHDDHALLQNIHREIYAEILLLEASPELSEATPDSPKMISGKTIPNTENQYLNSHAQNTLIAPLLLALLTVCAACLTPAAFHKDPLNLLNSEFGSIVVGGVVLALITAIGVALGKIISQRRNDEKKLALSSIFFVVLAWLGLIFYFHQRNPSSEATAEKSPPQFMVNNASLATPSVNSTPQPTTGNPLPQPTLVKPLLQPTPINPVPSDGLNIVTVTVSCSGDNPGAMITIKWGHPNLDQNTHVIRVLTGQRGNDILTLPIDSEFEIQTEGGHGTRYEIEAATATGNLSVKYDHGFHEVAGNGDIHIGWSSKPNDYGEGNIRVHIQ
jgi:hypothetical protein